jgi:hypothetical protein
MRENFQVAPTVVEGVFVLVVDFHTLRRVHQEAMHQD